MIVVAIIGILASIALPAYQDYTKRAHVSEGMSLASGAKSAVTEYHASEGTFPADNAVAGLAAAADISGNAVDTVTVSAGTGTGIITVDFDDVKVAAGDLVLTASDATGSITWDCTAATTLSKFVPTNCR
jgi:type IV pilus assembly protein PilA